MKMFPDQEIINTLKVKYKIEDVKVFGNEVTYEEGEDIEACYYYEVGDLFAEWDKEGNLVVSDFEEFFKVK